MAEYNIWAEVDRQVGKVRMPQIGVIIAYLDNRSKSIDEICSKIKEKDKKYCEEIREESKKYAQKHYSRRSMK